MLKHMEDMDEWGFENKSLGNPNHISWPNEFNVGKTLHLAVREPHVFVAELSRHGRAMEELTRHPNAA